VLGIAGQFRYTVIWTANTCCYHMYTILHYLPPVSLYNLWCGPCSRDRPENWFLALTWLQGSNYCPLIGHDPGVVIGLLSGHNTLRRHLYIMGLGNNPTCRKCSTEEVTSVHILCECEDLASLRHTHLGSFFLGPKDIRKLRIAAIWNFAKWTGLLYFRNRTWNIMGLS